MPLNKVCIGFVIITLFGHVWGCSGIRVSQDYDLSRDFSSLSTYAWQTESQPETGDIRVDNSLLDARFRSAINDSLTKRGYQKGEQENADFYVAYTYQIDSKIESSNVTVGFGLGGGSGGAFTGIGVDSGGRVREYDEGLLVIDLVDSSKKDLLWRGTGTSRVSQHANPENAVKDINETVEKILSQFPPQTN